VILHFLQFPQRINWINLFKCKFADINNLYDAVKQSLINFVSSFSNYFINVQDLSIPVLRLSVLEISFYPILILGLFLSGLIFNIFIKVKIINQ